MKKEELIKSLKNKEFPAKIISAFRKVERGKFIPEEMKTLSYEDIPLPIGFGATISQPYTIAFMLKHLKVKGKQKILEVGSGSGYVLALLSELSPKGKIFGVERIKELAEKSGEILKNKNIKVIHGDGSKGLKEEAPFDRILVSASADEIPEELIRQLKESGILIIPVKNSILVIKKGKRGYKKKDFSGFVFVPLVEE